jgi:ABC-type multidrug transport system fused ATPase/permease subunit
MTYTTILRTYLRPRRRLVLVVLLLLILGTVGEIAGPLLLGRFIDAAAGQMELRVLIWLAVAAVTVAVLTQMVTIVKTAAVARLAWSTTNALREDLTRHSLAAGEEARATRSPGELVERIDGDSTAIREFLSDFALLVVANAMFVVGVIIALLFIDWRLSLAVAVFTVITSGVFTLLRRYSVVDWGAAREASAQLWGSTEQHLSGFEELKRNGGARFIMTSLTAAMDRLTYSFRRARTRGNRIFVVTGAMVAVGQGAVLAVAVVLTLGGHISIGALFSTWFLLQLLEYPIDMLSKQLQHLQRATASIERLNELIPEPSARPAGTQPAPYSAPTVRVNGVSFAYGDRPVLHAVSLTLPAGSTTALVGPTGSGKSTLVKLLLGLRDGYSGAITLDGTELRELDPAELRRHVGLVPQQVHMFPGTVRDNITLLQPADDGAIESALTAIGLSTWLQRLPHGLDTHLEGTASLSAGEAQLFGITRALLHPCQLLILDEVTARLDPESESRLQQAIADLSGERTLLVIAHRLRTALLSDQVVVLNEGRVSEVGHPATLSADTTSQLSRIIDGMADAT